MQATPSNIWSVPAYLPYLQPPLTDEVVEAAEKQLGVSLPSEYLALLRMQNGGYIRLRRPESVGDVIAGIGPNFPSLLDFDWETDQEHVSYRLDGLVPFDGDGHWYLCLDYRDDSGTPSVTYVDIECDSQEYIAESFAEYLNQLTLDPDQTEGYAVLSSTDLPTVLSMISGVLGKPFEARGDQDHGYASYRCQWNSGPPPEWIWASPNRVARGFVRHTDVRYGELKKLMQGTALRYPEVPQATCLISATGGAESAMLAACKSANLKVCRLCDLL